MNLVIYFFSYSFFPSFLPSFIYSPCHSFIQLLTHSLLYWLHFPTEGIFYVKTNNPDLRDEGAALPKT